MNTVKKGDDFEEKAYKLISKLLNNHQLGVVPAHCEVFKKKGYYSAKREKYIIFDLSIEVWPPGAKNYTFLYLIECKDYSGSVSVDRIESFDSKIRQIGDHNIKAVFITTSRLQEGGRALCEKMGVMLIRCGRNMTYDIILHRVGGKRPYRRNIETEEPYSFKTLKDVLLSEWTKAVDIKLLEAVSRLGSLYKISGTSVPVLSRKDIESLAIRILDNYSRNILRNSEVISIEPFIKYLSDAFDL
ncbi:MAG: restriction endonuclease, partial [Bacteroidota bacterium]